MTLYDITYKEKDNISLIMTDRIEADGYTIRDNFVCFTKDNVMIASYNNNSWIKIIRIE